MTLKEVMRIHRLCTAIAESGKAAEEALPGLLKDDIEEGVRDTLLLQARHCWMNAEAVIELIEQSR